MKKVYILLLGLYLAMGLSACQATSVVEPTQTEEEQPLVLESEEEISASLLQNAEYDRETDYPYYAGTDQMGAIAYTEDGYYYFYNSYLYFFDRESGQNVKLCTKLNCDHEGVECDAYFSELYYPGQIWYSEGYLYTLKRDSSFTVYMLVRLETDGSGSEILTELHTVESEDMTDVIRYAIVHRGYIYYTILNFSYESAGLLYRCELTSGAEPELWYEFSEAQSNLDRLRGYGDGLFFEASYYTDAEMLDYQGGIYYIGTGDTEAILVLDQVFYDYTVVGTELLYADAEGVYAYDYETGETRTILELGMASDIAYDGEYLWVDDYWGRTLYQDEDVQAGRTLYKLDLQGNILEQWNLPADEVTINYFGDSEYLFMVWLVEETVDTELLEALGLFVDGAQYTQSIRAYNKRNGTWTTLTS